MSGLSSVESHIIYPSLAMARWALCHDLGKSQLILKNSRFLRVLCFIIMKLIFALNLRVNEPKSARLSPSIIKAVKIFLKKCYQSLDNLQKSCFILQVAFFLREKVPNW